MSWIVRILIIILVVRAIMRLLGGIRAGIAQGSVRGKPDPVQLVRDPTCGTFVVPARALPLTAGGATHYFCSDRCRESYVAKSRA
jgi:YHS domain-containing protein